MAGTVNNYPVCDTCGCYCGDMVDGLCPCCNKKYKPTTLGESLWNTLTNLIRKRGQNTNNTEKKSDDPSHHWRRRKHW